MKPRRRNELHRLDVYRCALQLYRLIGRIVAQFPRGEAKELIVALDCVEIDQLAPIDLVIAGQDLADRIAAMLTKMIRRAETQ